MHYNKVCFTAQVMKSVQFLVDVMSHTGNRL